MPKYDFPNTKDYDTTRKYVEDVIPDGVSEENIKKNNNTIIYEAFPVENLKIIEVKNTKVIKQGNNLAEGRIVYRIPNIMKVRSTYKVLVRISKSKATVSLYDSLQGTIMTSKIPVTETMEVKLIDLSSNDNKAFHISDGNSGVQIIESGDTYTEWSWSVTPIITGNSRLKIVVSVIRDNNKKDIVYEDTVEVEKDFLVQIMFFFKKYWQVLMTSIAVPFIVWIYKRRKEKKEKSDENKI
ncbi:MAG: hypothetical protein IPJ01_11020 [Micavibrio sp.]|nr:hypothetical protein [Micavibrio sp.]